MGKHYSFFNEKDNCVMTPLDENGNLTVIEVDQMAIGSPSAWETRYVKPEQNAPWGKGWMVQDVDGTKHWWKTNWDSPLHR
jgi:hypothetical protein